MRKTWPRYAVCVCNTCGATKDPQDAILCMYTLARIIFVDSCFLRTLCRPDLFLTCVCGRQKIIIHVKESEKVNKKQKVYIPLALLFTRGYWMYKASRLFYDGRLPVGNMGPLYERGWRARGKTFFLSLALGFL